MVLVWLNYPTNLNKSNGILNKFKNQKLRKRLIRQKKMPPGFGRHFFLSF